MNPAISGSASAVRNDRTESGLSVLMWFVRSFLVGARPAGVFNCLRMFCVDRMPLVKPAAIAVLPSLATTSVVTKTSFVVTGSVQKNSGMGSPVYLLGSALGDF